MSTKDQTRLQRVLPHAVALLAGASAFQARTIVLGRESELLEVAYFIALMTAPYIGASAVLVLQNQLASDDKRQVVSPYLWWGGSGAGAFVLLAILAQAARGSNGFLFWGTLVVVVLVPIGVPLLRTIMWLVSPPASTVKQSEATVLRDE